MLFLMIMKLLLGSELIFLKLHFTQLKVVPLLGLKSSTLYCFRKQNLTFIYLGFPIYHGREKDFLFSRSHSEDLLSHHQVAKLFVLNEWMTGLDQACYAIYFHYVLAALDPPKQVIKNIEKIFSSFLWGSHEDFDERNWMSWSHICHPIGSNGLGVLSLSNLSKAFAGKLQWIYRTKRSLWTDFIRSRYSDPICAFLILLSLGSPILTLGLV